MSEIEEVKARLDIVEYISAYTQLKRSGRNYKGLCPFHNEKTPSFVVFPDTQTWRCFGACGEGGDIFSFAMKQEGWGFGEALRILAERAGVTLKPRGNQPRQIETYERLRALLAEATTYYNHLLLNAPEAARARAYVAGRKLNDATVQAFMLGYAPDSWDATRKFLQGKGYTEQEIIEAGLMVVREEEGKRYDRFRQRLMIPIRDGRGRTVGFGARALDPDAIPKYLNSPQSVLFDKSRILFGLDMSRRGIREQETAVLVEGYMDVMQAHQAGYGNLVAQMGTALSAAQLAQLSKYARRLILALDPDAAGMKATMRDLEVARKTLSEQSINVQGMIVYGGRLNLDIRVLSLPKGYDPDALIREQPEEWPRLLDSALPVAEYVIRRSTEGRDLGDAFERERIARALLPILAATESQVQRYSNLQALARIVRIQERTLIEWAGQQPKPQARRKPAQAVKAAPRRGTGEFDEDEGPPPRVFEGETPRRPAPLPPTTRHERYCLALLIKRPELIYRVDRRLQELALSRLQADDFSQAGLQEVFRTFQAALAQDALSPIDYMYTSLPPLLVEILDHLQRERLGDLEDAHVVDEALGALLRLRKSSLLRRLNEVRFLQTEARERGDEARAAELAGIISLYAQALRLLDKALDNRVVKPSHQ